MCGQGTFRMATAYNADDQIRSITYPDNNANTLRLTDIRAGTASPWTNL